MKNKIIIIIILAVILAVAVYAVIDRIAVYALSRACNLEIKYGRLERSGIIQLDFLRLACVDRARGFGISSERATVRPDFRKWGVDFDLHGVRFLRKASEASTSLDSLSKIIEEPFTGNWNYMRMSGSLRPIRGGIEITRFKADGEEMRISIKGSVFRDGTIKSDIDISFSAKMTEKIPEELSAVLLSDEPGLRKGLSVSLTGDYKSPSIQVTGKLFRLSVKEVAEVK
jgi:hypothetical protein